MKRKPKGAPAPAFLVISPDHPRYTNYTGTKEQIISLGLVVESDFPVAPKRQSYGKGALAAGKYDPARDFLIKKIKGGRFELRRWHECHEKRHDLPFVFRAFISDGKPKWSLHGTGLHEIRETSQNILWDAMEMAIQAIRDEIVGQAKRGFGLKLVEAERIAERPKASLVLVEGGTS